MFADPCHPSKLPITTSPSPSAPLQALNKAADAASVAIKGEGSEEAARYVAGMAANLIDVKNFEEAEWTQVRTPASPELCAVPRLNPGQHRPVCSASVEGYWLQLYLGSIASPSLPPAPPVPQSVVPFLAPFCGDAGAAAVCKEFHAACFQEAQARVMAPVEEEEGEDLCNCEFSLAYGGKILLNNARLHLKRGQRYGLCGPNGAGKSTLMRAIGEWPGGRAGGVPACCVAFRLDACMHSARLFMAQWWVAQDTAAPAVLTQPSPLNPRFCSQRPAGRLPAQV